jgi:Zn-dependent metalloprotease
LILFAGSLFSTGLFAQQIASSTRHGASELPDRITFHEGMTATALVPVLEQELGWPKAYGLHPKGRPIEDKLGWTHQRYQQLYQGVPVFGATVVVHEQEGTVRSLNGELAIASTDGSPTPSLSPEAVLEAAKRSVGARSYMWESPEMEAFIKRERNDPLATFRPAPELVYYPVAFPRLDGQMRLAYKLDIYAMAPRSRQYVLVDALNGEVLNTISRIHDINEPGTAQTAYSGTRPIITYRPAASGPYELKDLSRGAGIITYDCQNTADYTTAVVPTSLTNDWDLGSLYANSILDAHWGTEQTYDYYLDEHNWDSFDNEGSPMLSYAHFNLIAYGYPSNNNAFWDGERMTYGDGNGTSMNPLTAIDVAGHEITHGVTEFSAGLVYQDEPGALNESFSDIMGSCIEFFAKPEGFSWMLGNDMSISGSGFRNMSDPNLYGDPDTYHGNFWVFDGSDNGGVHTNSGVQNYWFYLLTEGGSGTNDNGDAYSVQGIGFADAGAIAFRNLTVYLNVNSDYADARAGAVQAATDLFGGCSPQVVATTNAWYAVGVGPAFNNAVVAGFSASSNYSCEVPATVQFTNTSLNASTYLWDLGDGNSSTSASPSHTYDAVGSYTVTLVATGSTVCNTTDTLIALQPIVVEDDGALAPAACQPAATSPPSDAGIFDFSFADIQKPSTGAVDGYQDFSCEQVAGITEGLSYPLNVILHIPGYIALWIDLDDDGDFTPAEMAYASNGESMVHNADVIIPAPSVFDARLRMRVIASTQPITSACAATGGQAEDYSVRIGDNTAAPIAAFTADPVTVLIGSSVSFQDLSLNVPTTWEWTFAGGDITASAQQAPQVQYATVGDYDVQLIVTNAHGSDTLLIPAFIHVVNSFNLCQVTSTTAATGTFHDTGGANGNYSNNETCTLLIAPPCAASVTVTFHAFNTESNWDFLRFYDGPNEAAPSLGQFSGSTIPASFTTSGGHLFVKWTSDQSVNRSGFEVEWTSQTGSEEPITAIASADDLTPAFGQAVQFSDNSLETPSAWTWDLGDGTTSAEQNPMHVYLTSGPKTVVLTASNCVSTDTDTLHVLVGEPGAISLATDTLYLNGNTCTDSTYGSFSIHNSGNGPLAWSLGSRLDDTFEGANINPVLWTSSTGVSSSDCGAHTGTRSHRFSMDGIRTIVTLPLNILPNSHFTFYLKYGTGGSCETVEAGEYVVIEYSLNGTTWNPVASFPDLSAYADWALVDAELPPAAVNSQSQLRIRQVAHSGFSYDVWAIDDVSLQVGYAGPLTVAPSEGTIASLDSTEVAVSVSTSSYPPGTHQEELEIHSTDPGQPVVTVPVVITIADMPCAQFDFTYQGGCQEVVQFNNATVNDAGIWHWDFGDGSSSDEQSPTHAYTAMGDYTVTLTAGTPPLSTTYTQVVHADPVSAQIAHSDADAGNGTVVFQPNSNGAVQWLWDFGDGSTSTDEVPTHTYAAWGGYTVILAAWNASGCAAMDTVMVLYGPVGIAEPSPDAVAVLPNPSQGHFTVRLKGMAGPVRAWILDGTGRMVSGEQLLHNGDNAMDISGLADGMYILRLRLGDAWQYMRIGKQ